MLYKTGVVGSIRPLIIKESDSQRLGPVQEGRIYLELDGLDGDKFNSNHDLFPWYPDWCNFCNRYVYGMSYKGLKYSASEDEYCPDCGEKLDGGLLATNNRGVMSWKSWIGRPLCVAHKSDDPALFYGEIVDALPYHDNKTVRMVISADKTRLEKDHPGLLGSYEHGLAKDVSQGSRVGYSLCSKCGHKATTEEEYCDHITKHRGQLMSIGSNDHPYPHAIGPEGFVRVGECCYDVDGVEMSLVGHGACDQAKVRAVLKSSANQELEHLNLTDLARRLSQDPQYQQEAEMLSKIASELGESLIETLRKVLV